MSKSEKAKDEFLGIWQKRLYIFIAVCGIIYGASTQVWGILLKPRVQAEIKTAMDPVVKEIKSLKGLMQYQNLILLIDKDISERELIDSSYSMLKRGPE